MMKKSFYETPEAELLLVKFEEGFLTTSPVVNTTNSRTGTEYFLSGEDNYDEL